LTASQQRQAGRSFGREKERYGRVTRHKFGLRLEVASFLVIHYRSSPFLSQIVHRRQQTTTLIPANRFMATSSRSRSQQPNAAEMRKIQEEEAQPYVITSEIGKGSFATVFKGYHNVS
jgi:hypothetical protein